MDPTIVVALIGSATTLYIARKQRQMSKKVDETHTQTTQNGHKHSPPTIPDQLGTLSKEVKGLHGRLDAHEKWHRQHQN